MGFEPAIPASERLRTNGIASFSGSPGKKKLGPPISKITNCEGIKIVYWISFYLAQSLKIYRVEKIFFFPFNIFIFPPLGPCDPGGLHHSCLNSHSHTHTHTSYLWLRKSKKSLAPASNQTTFSQSSSPQPGHLITHLSKLPFPTSS